MTTECRDADTDIDISQSPDSSISRGYVNTAVCRWPSISSATNCIQINDKRGRRIYAGYLDVAISIWSGAGRMKEEARSRVAVLQEGSFVPIATRSLVGRRSFCQLMAVLPHFNRFCAIIMANVARSQTVQNREVSGTPRGAWMRNKSLRYRRYLCWWTYLCFWDFPAPT